MKALKRLAKKLFVKRWMNPLLLTRVQCNRLSGYSDIRKNLSVRIVS